MIGADAGEVMAVLQIAMPGGVPFTVIRDKAVLTHPTMAERLGGCSPESLLRRARWNPANYWDPTCDAIDPGPFVRLHSTLRSGETRAPTTCHVDGGLTAVFRRCWSRFSRAPAM